jgi:hypothetical protein
MIFQTNIGSQYNDIDLNFMREEESIISEHTLFLAYFVA